MSTRWPFDSLHVRELHTAVELTPTPRPIANMSINNSIEEDIKLRLHDCMETENSGISERLFNAGSTFVRHGEAVFQIERISISQDLRYGTV